MKWKTKFSQGFPTHSIVFSLKLQLYDLDLKKYKELLSHKGYPPSVDLRYGEEDSISPSTLIFAATKG